MTEPRQFVLRLLPIAEIDPVETAALINQAFNRHETMEGDRTEPSTLLEEAGPASEFIQVSGDDGQLVATAMICPGESAGLEGRILDYVDPAQVQYYGLAGVADGLNGTGIGGMLLREAERIARARMKRSLVLTTLREFGLPPYYERRGFVTRDTKMFEAGHWNVSVEHEYHVMQKPLELTIRPATVADVERITEVVNAAYRAEDFFINGNRTNAEDVDALVVEGAFLVLERQGAVIGAVYVTRDRNRSYFGMLSMDPVLKGTGLGRLLVDALEQRATDAGCEVSDLQVVNLREELIPWYRRMGYVANGTLPFPDPWKLKRPAHMIAMSKPLTGGSAGTGLEL